MVASLASSESRLLEEVLYASGLKFWSRVRPSYHGVLAAMPSPLQMLGQFPRTITAILSSAECPCGFGDMGFFSLHFPAEVKTWLTARGQMVFE